jgi:ankyrin repeat protein
MFQNHDDDSADPPADPEHHLDLLPLVMQACCDNDPSAISSLLIAPPSASTSSSSSSFSSPPPQAPNPSVVLNALHRGWTPLTFSARHGNPQVASTLLALGALPAFTIDSGRNALHVAAIYDQLPVIRVLLDVSPSLVSSRDDYGFTALHYAATHMNLDVAKLLVSRGCPLNSRNVADHTALDLATAHSEVYNFLSSFSIV